MWETEGWTLGKELRGAVEEAANVPRRQLETLRRGGVAAAAVGGHLLRHLRHLRHLVHNSPGMRYMYMYM